MAYHAKKTDAKNDNLPARAKVIADLMKKMSTVLKAVATLGLDEDERKTLKQNIKRELRDEFEGVQKFGDVIRGIEADLARRQTPYADIVNDATTHRKQWLELFDDQIQTADDSREDTSYWRHERRVFERLLDTIPKLSTSSDQMIDFSSMPDEADFLVGSTNSGLTVHARVGDVEEFGDTPQEALDAAILKFSEGAPLEETIASSTSVAP